MVGMVVYRVYINSCFAVFVVSRLLVFLLRAWTSEVFVLVSDCSVLFFAVLCRHSIEFLIGDQPLPYNMTIFQAIKQYGLVS